MACRRKPYFARNLAALVLVVFLFQAASAGATSPSMRQLKDRMFSAMLQAGEAAPGDREDVIAFYPVRMADINGDGRPEYFLTGPCTTICRCRVFTRSPGGGMDMVLSVDCMPEGLTILGGAQDGGWKTLMAPIASYGFGGVKRFYAFKDGAYRQSRKECYALNEGDGRLVRTACPKDMP